MKLIIFTLTNTSGLPWYLINKESSWQYRRGRFSPWLGKILGEGNGNPVQFSCLGNPMDRGSWWATVHEVAKSQTRLSTHTLRLNERDLISSQLYACSETGTLEPGIK